MGMFKRVVYRLDEELGKRYEDEIDAFEVLIELMEYKIRVFGDEYGEKEIHLTKDGMNAFYIATDRKAKSMILRPDGAETLRKFWLVDKSIMMIPNNGGLESMLNRTLTLGSVLL